MEINLENAVYYHQEGFPPTTIDYSRIIHPLMEAGAALARYDEALGRLHNRELFLAPLRNQEVVASSRMEGTISTMDEILQYDSSKDDDEEDDILKANVRSDVIETILYRRALRYAQQEIGDGRPISDGLIRSMHQMLLSFGRGAAKKPGQYKTEQNYIGDERNGNISYVPISPEKLPEGMDRLFDYIKQSEHPELIRTALAHVEFEALHPFKDGNGRIGRMLITLMLWSGGDISSPHFYISRYMEEHKAAYIARMKAVSSGNDWMGWLSFFFEAVKDQAKYNLEMISRIGELYEAMKPIFSDITGSRYSIALLDAIFTSPRFDNRRISKLTGISPATVNRFTNTLLAHPSDLVEIVQPAAGRRGAIYSFEPLLQIIRV